jgi:hypothetical protein
MFSSIAIAFGESDQFAASPCIQVPLLAALYASVSDSAALLQAWIEADALAHAVLTNEVCAVPLVQPALPLVSAPIVFRMLWRYGYSASSP